MEVPFTAYSENSDRRRSVDQRFSVSMDPAGRDAGVFGGERTKVL